MISVHVGFWTDFSGIVQTRPYEFVTQAEVDAFCLGLDLGVHGDYVRVFTEPRTMVYHDRWITEPEAIALKLKGAL